MQPVLAVFDNFFDQFDRVYSEISRGHFREYLSPFDGVVYPGINDFIPRFVSDEIERRLQAITGRDVLVTAMFARLSLGGVYAPHKIHSDKIMGQYSMHVYLSPHWPCGGGTSFWEHKTQGCEHNDDTDVEVIQRDQNDSSKWNQKYVIQARANRALIHRSTSWHAAEPAGGFGDNPRNGRLVLTTFFSEGLG